MTTKTRASRVREYRPSVENLQLTVNPEREDRCQWHDDPKYCERHDVYYEGSVRVNDVNVPIEVHLMSCDGSIKGTAGKYDYTAKVNKQEGDYRTCGHCPYCSGNRGVSSKQTKGLTAEALADVVVPFLESEGYELYYDNHKPGGWFLFDLQTAKVERNDLEATARGRFNVAWMEQHTCPVHGCFLWKEEECGL